MIVVLLHNEFNVEDITLATSCIIDYSSANNQYRLISSGNLGSSKKEYAAPSIAGPGRSWQNSNPIIGLLNAILVRFQLQEFRDFCFFDRGHLPN